MERLDCIIQRMHTNTEYCVYVFSTRDYSRTFHVIIYRDRQRKVKKCDVCSQLFAHKPISVLIFPLWLF